MRVTLRDFCPINRWEQDVKGEKWGGYDHDKADPKFLIDKTTNRKYFNESTGCVRFKCSLLALGTPVVHAIASVCNVAYRIAKVVSLSHFWMHHEKASKCSFKARALDAGKDLLRIVTMPITLAGLELAAIYGMFRPYDGRKLYASVERATYGHFILAPCFQPDPMRHALGGDINKKNAF